MAITDGVGTPITDTDVYPAYTDKEDVLRDLQDAIEREDIGAARTTLYKLGNTDVSGISNATATLLSAGI